MAFIIFFVLGFIIFTFIGLQAVLSITFGIPYTMKLEKEGQLKNSNNILRRFFTIIMISIIIFLVIYLLVEYFAPPLGVKGFAFGCGVSFLLSLPRLFSNKDNIDDYIKLNGQFLINKTDDNK